MSCQEEGRNQAVEVTKGVPGGNSGRLIDKENPTQYGYPTRQRSSATDGAPTCQRVCGKRKKAVDAMETWRQQLRWLQAFHALWESKSKVNIPGRGQLPVGGRDSLITE